MTKISDTNGLERKRLAQRISAYGRAEDGAVLIFGLIIFVLMLMVSGIAVDVMRYESERVRLQGTSDRAVLAATSLMNNNVSMTPAELAQAYFDAEGLGQFAQGNITVNEDPINGRTVRITPSASMDTMFLRLSNIDRLNMAAPAAAVEGRGRDTKLEIVMVLDKSGSMATRTSTGRTRLQEMQLAAKSFATSMFDEFDEDHISISLVTYDAWVVPAPGLLNSMTNVSGSGACMEFDDWIDVRANNSPSVLGGVSNAPSLAELVNSSLFAEGTRVNCWAPPEREMKPMLNALGTLETAIDAVTANGTTSIDLGARFGAMMLDPSMRPYIDMLVTNGTLPETMRGRPYDWDAPSVTRAFILLTDGQNCCGARFNRSVQDQNTLAVCNSLKANDVMVYTVSFEAPQGGIDLLSECASSPNHFFNSDGAGLIAAFDAIGTSVRAQSLRLTQ